LNGRRAATYRLAERMVVRLVEGIVKAYLDSNVVVSIVENDAPDQSEALDQLLAAFK